MEHLNRFVVWLPVALFFATSLPAAGPNARLVDAVKNTDRAAIRSLLQQHADVNAPDVDGATALHWAARWDDVETAQLLIRGGANVKAVNRYSVTPLSLACTNGNAAMIELLVNAGADPNAALPGGETPLMTAARTGKVDAVKVLLSHGANVQAQEDEGQTALMWAAAEGNTATVEMLMEFGADSHARSKGGLTALLFAVREGRADVVRFLLKAGVSPNETVERSKTSPRHFATLSFAGTNALLLAVANAHFELASTLLDAGADPNATGRGWTPLHAITWIRKPGYGTNDPAPEGSGSMDSLELVRRLVAHGANLNARMTRHWSGGTTILNMTGATPFLMAARTGDAELMRLFAKLGADPLLPNEDGTTPLMVAAGVGTRSPGEDPGPEKEALEAVKVAVELGGDVNAVDKNGETAMHGAAYKQLPAVVEFLYEHGAKVEIWNQKNQLGWTPLRIAEGVHRTGNLRSSAITAAALRKVMSEAGVSTVVEPEVLDERPGFRP
jgi:ankyrin repeat protein